jgi:hypothetical protein
MAFIEALDGFLLVSDIAESKSYQYAWNFLLFYVDFEGKKEFNSIPSFL